MIGGVSMGAIAAAGGGGGAPPSWSQPYNRYYKMIGDSRTAMGASLVEAYGSTGVTKAPGTGGPDAFIEAATAFRLLGSYEYPNAGGAAQTVEQILAYPRTGSSTRDLDQIAAMDVGTVVLYMGTNNSASPATLVAGGTARLAIADAIAALTNPAQTWAAKGSPLALNGGRAKNVIIINETPRGVTALNAVNNSAGANAATFKAWADWLLTFDFRSGHANANPRVVVVDVFNHPTILDAASGTNYHPVAGLFADGLHPSPTGGKRVGGIVGAAVAPLITDFAPLDFLPTVANLASGGWLTPNPHMNAGASAGVVAGGATLNNNSAIPASTSVTCSNATGLTIDSSAAPAANGEGNAYTIRVTGTPSSNASITIKQVVAAAQRATTNMAVEKYRAMAHLDLAIASGTVYECALNAMLLGAAGDYTRQIVSRSAAYGIGTAAGYSNNAAYPLTVENPYVSNEGAVDTLTPLLDPTPYATGNIPLSEVYVTLKFIAGTAVDVTLSISQLGLKAMSA